MTYCIRNKGLNLSYQGSMTGPKREAESDLMKNSGEQVVEHV